MPRRREGFVPATTMPSIFSLRPRMMRQRTIPKVPAKRVISLQRAFRACPLRATRTNPVYSPLPCRAVGLKRAVVLHSSDRFDLRAPILQERPLGRVSLAEAAMRRQRKALPPPPRSLRSWRRLRPLALASVPRTRILSPQLAIWGRGIVPLGARIDMKGATTFGKWCGARVKTRCVAAFNIDGVCYLNVHNHSKPPPPARTERLFRRSHFFNAAAAMAITSARWASRAERSYTKPRRR